MAKTDKGKLVISAAKSLKRYQLSDANIATFLYATLFAGRAGLFASALRGGGRMALSRVHVLAGTEGFSILDVRNTLLPWVESAGLAPCWRSRESA